MCFSVEASFGTGVILSAIGIGSVKKATHAAHQLFASIPLLFGIQQFTEALLWISIPNNEWTTVQTLSTYIYLSFAQILWPI